MRARIHLILTTPQSPSAASCYTVWSVDPVTGLVLQHEEHSLAIGEIPKLASAFDQVRPFRESIEFAGSRYEVRGTPNAKGDIFVICLRCFSSLDRELGKERLVLVGSDGSTELVPTPSDEAVVWWHQNSRRFFEPSVFLDHCSPIDRRMTA